MSESSIPIAKIDFRPLAGPRIVWHVLPRKIGEYEVYAIDPEGRPRASERAIPCPRTADRVNGAGDDADLAKRMRVAMKALFREHVAYFEDAETMLQVTQRLEAFASTTPTAAMAVESPFAWAWKVGVNANWQFTTDPGHAADVREMAALRGKAWALTGLYTTPLFAATRLGHTLVEDGYAPTDAEVSAWMERSELSLGDGSIDHWRTVINDARSMHMLKDSQGGQGEGE